ncbi:hypothetical protein A2662_00215 [Candidatus Giovannonibacteria bacterium RIFCSPHIGHO2_01_FULL_45_33]|uniref:General secretion pathway GspH domain-containing protein n=1 Tax=Candidatus Giovannonibacteria bacterium RIFCSPLOWO2_01_FULL_45_34 TaxID=1798351 RepID=A0A1F5X0P7_9BACT|nr:MAG: hypothetical protein A2662_00215 [Candidatus Giovannonibacteria bacterium RIFCSPHIGHO2_01_FULL_45_33]OGF70745.1 MAG: hypothetical protein A3C73_03190 [Candidatus Giovannonibacteria bacterium RIFCSPHIGHO2_02_FULL_44_11]OGF81464.1 MAG: hypothetical protein A2930_04440 [Candidatus Giovannonibacteria bacterium RIFCSPLOWO2_01_FULL_45_34]
MKGFTLLEILVSMAIIVVLSALIFSVMSSFGESNKLTEANSGIIGLLRDARSRTLASEFGSNFGVHFENTKAVLFRGDVYDSASPANESYLLPPSIEISAIDLTAGAVDTVFTRLYGTTTASGTVTLRSRSVPAKIHTVSIYSTGGIK